MTRLPSVSRFRRDDRGTFTVMFSMAILPLILVIGIAIDYSAITRDRGAFQAAVDAAVVGAGKLNDADERRVELATKIFESQLKEEQRAMIQGKTFTVENGATKVVGRVQFRYPGRFSGFIKALPLDMTVTASALVAKPVIRQLDLVMCIDATGSMSNTLTAVKNNALNFESNLNAALQARGITPFEAMRVRVIYYRDYAGSYTGPTRTVTVRENGRNVTKTYTEADAAFWTYAGDNPPMKSSSFYALPAERTSFSGYVSPESASGGGDLPEAGLECVHDAMTSTWTPLGTTISGVNKPLDALYPTIVVWTDAAAHGAGYGPATRHPSYPAAMPRTTDLLRAKWNNPAVIDQSRKMLVFFGNPDVVQSNRDGQARGWADVKTWSGFLQGGTLTEGTNNLVTKIADAIAYKLKMPVLTH